MTNKQIYGIISYHSESVAVRYATYYFMFRPGTGQYGGEFMELTKSFSGSGRQYYAGKCRVTKKGKLLIVLGTCSEGEAYGWPDAWQTDDDETLFIKLEGDWFALAEKMSSKWATVAVRRDGRHVQVALDQSLNRPYGFAFDIN